MLIASSPSIAAAGRRSIRAPLRRRAPVVLALRHRSFLAREAARLRAHFREVLAELRASDLAPFSASQRAARARLIEALERYARAGSFPRNLDFPGVRVPYFVDAKGTRCAMAHLIESTGAPELVARVAAMKNNAFIRELSTDPALLSWLEEAGLTVAEAARIQPTYCYLSKAEVCVCRNTARSLSVVEGIVTEKSPPKDFYAYIRVKVTSVYGDSTLATVDDMLWVAGSNAEIGDSVLFGTSGISDNKIVNNPSSWSRSRATVQSTSGAPSMYPN